MKQLIAKLVRSEKVAKAIILVVAPFRMVIALVLGTISGLVLAFRTEIDHQNMLWALAGLGSQEKGVYIWENGKMIKVDDKDLEDILKEVEDEQ